MLRLVAATLSMIVIFSTATGRAEVRKVKVVFDTPATNYDVMIQEVYHVGDALWVISNVLTIGDVGGAAITRVSDEIKVEAAKDLQIFHKVLGKGWNWGEDTKSLQYVKSEKDLKKQLKALGAKRIWRREKSKPKGGS